MANSRFEYVKTFEKQHQAIPETYIVIRIDGRGFTKFCNKHKFKKPNDDNALLLMNEAAKAVFHTDNFPSGSLTCAYGHSDEYSFIFCRKSDIFDRRLDKIMSLVVSIFSSAYVFHWTKYFPETKLQFPPSFDARWVEYPNYTTIRDYISWRQADAHINNQYNYCFWKLWESNEFTSKNEVQLKLKNTVTKDKNEILFSKFGINYNDLPEMHRKGTIIYRRKAKSSQVEIEHCDVIRDEFWNDKPWLLSDLKRGRNVEKN